MTTRANTCEGTNGVAVTTSNTGGPDQFTSTTELAFSNAQVYGGGTSILFHHPDSVDTNLAATWSSLTSTSAGYVRFYAYFTSTPVVAMRLARWRASSSLASLHFTTAGKLQVRNATLGVVGTTTNSVPLNQWIRIEFDLTNLSGTTGNVAARFYDGAQLDGFTPTETISATGITTNSSTLTEIGFGNPGVNLATAWDFYFDTVDYSDVSQPGPANPPGYMASTLANATMSASGSESEPGVVAVLLDGLTVSGSGNETLSGQAIATVGGLDLAATASEILPGTLAAPLGELGMAASTAFPPGALIVFGPPTHEEAMATNVRPLNYYRLTWGDSLVRVNGVFVRMRFPKPTVLQAAGVQGRDYFIGGYTYQIPEDVAQELVEAGYLVQVWPQ